MAKGPEKTQRFVFFDAVGTLVRQVPTLVDVIQAECSKWGRQVSRQEVARAYRTVAPNLRSGEIGQVFARDDRIQAKFWRDIYRRTAEVLGLVGARPGEAIFATLSRPEAFGAFPEVLQTIEALRQRNIGIGVISNFDGSLDKVLRQVGVRADVVIGSGREGLAKPDPGLYRLALERAGVRPNEATHVGDVLELDVEPAVEVGMAGVLLVRGSQSARSHVRVIRSLSEIVVDQ